MATYSTATTAEVIAGSEEQFENLIIDMVEAERTDLIDKIEEMIGGPLPRDAAGALLLCSCRRGKGSAE